MKLSELRSEFLKGNIEKRLYFQIARENYMHILPQLQKVVAENNDVQSVEICKEGVVLTKSSGIKLFFDFRQAVCRAEADILLDVDPEHEDMDYIGNYLEKASGCSVLDIGANVGMFSLELYRRNTDAKFYLFEPIPNSYEGLLKTAGLNEVIEDRYIAYNVGMSSQRGSFDFYVPASCEAASLVANDDPFYRRKADSDGNYTGDTEIEKVVCKVETVDFFVREHKIDNIVFIKIDVEGNEKFVLEGAKETLLKERPLVYCELLRKHAKRFGYHPNEVISFMAELNYECKTIRDGKMTEIKSITEETEETNFFFFPLAH